MEGYSSSQFDPPEEFDIEEADDNGNVASSVVEAGSIEEWSSEHIEAVLEARMRFYIVILLLVVWVICVITVLILAVLTRNPAWLYTLAVFTPLLAIPLRHYYQQKIGASNSPQKKRYGHFAIKKKGV